MVPCFDVDGLAPPPERIYTGVPLLSTPHPSGFARHLLRFAEKGRAIALKFKERAGHSPFDYLTRWRMLLAGDKLTSSGDSVSVIARSLGYESESAFSTFALERTYGRIVRASGPRADDYQDGHPSAADVLLLVEVSETSLSHDRGTKLPLYAKFGVPEVWIVDLLGAAIEVYREPAGNAYARKERLTSGSLAPVQLPSVTIDAGALLA
jgi:hypothetical protein